MKNANFLHFPEKKIKFTQEVKNALNTKKIIFADKNFDAPPLSSKKDDHW